MIPIPPAPISNQALADLLCTIMVLCKGFDDRKQPIWAYLCIKPSMAQSFKQARERGGFDVSEYGTVLESGNGLEPPAEIKTKMERDYGMNHNFEAELLERVAALQAKASQSA